MALSDKIIPSSDYTDPISQVGGARSVLSDIGLILETKSKVWSSLKM